MGVDTYPILACKNMLLFSQALAYKNISVSSREQTDGNKVVALDIGDLVGFNLARLHGQLVDTAHLLRHLAGEVNDRLVVQFSIQEMSSSRVGTCRPISAGESERRIAREL